ncbi:MAG: hypothetical protein R3B06_25410 [Kofleriaceae bacterium]
MAAYPKGGVSVRRPGRCVRGPGWPVWGAGFALVRTPGHTAGTPARGVEVILNGNTREASLDPYTSMVLEKTLADPVAAHPAFPQHVPSSELVRHPLAPRLAPAYTPTEPSPTATSRRERRGHGATVNTPS